MHTFSFLTIFVSSLLIASFVFLTSCRHQFKFVYFVTLFKIHLVAIFSGDRVCMISREFSFPTKYLGLYSLMVTCLWKVMESDVYILSGLIWRNLHNSLIEVRSQTCTSVLSLNIDMSPPGTSIQKTGWLRKTSGHFRNCNIRQRNNSYF